MRDLVSHGEGSWLGNMNAEAKLLVFQVGCCAVSRIRVHGKIYIRRRPTTVIHPSPGSGSRLSSPARIPLNGTSGLQAPMAPLNTNIKKEESRQRERIYILFCKLRRMFKVCVIILYSFRNLHVNLPQAWDRFVLVKNKNKLKANFMEVIIKQHMSIQPLSRCVHR